MKLQSPIPKILLPVDGSDHAKNAVQFAGCLGSLMGKGMTDFTVLYVMAGGFLSRHMANIDFRTEVLMRSEAFKRIKEEHMEKDIMPLLDEAERILKATGAENKIEKLIVDGDPANEIIQVANKGDYSTIIMARSGQTGTKGSLLGDVANKVIHTASKQTVYIVGQRSMTDPSCPIPKILIPIDGSLYAMKGVHHASSLASQLKGSLRGITLLRIINLALYMERLKEGIDPEKEANKILNEGKDICLKAGVSEGLISTIIRTGKPAEEIQKEADEGDYSMIIMGRKGRTAFKDLILGGVSSAVLQRCPNQTIAIASGE